jgi:ParB family chromosome partitioning protein
MTQESSERELRMIPMDRIDVLNTRERNQQTFAEIVDSIQAIGLKKPITVTTRSGADGAERYLLVCGEGRFKAYRTLGETTIPALIVDASDEDSFIISLVENIARRQHSPLELLAGITDLQKKGYSIKLIAQKTGLSGQYVQDILAMVAQGEERLLAAVQKGTVSISAARAIAGAGDDDKAIQAALQQAYESGELRGKQLIDARRLIDRRKLFGRSIARGNPKKGTGVTSASLVRAFQKEVLRQRSLVRKSSIAQQQVMFVVGALRQVLKDDDFVNLLRAESLDSLPRYLAERVVITGAQA